MKKKQKTQNSRMPTTITKILIIKCYVEICKEEVSVVALPNSI